MSGELRITGGRLVRRRLRVPPGAERGDVRPTSDRAREALFSALGSARIEDARVLDAFDGSGALGIEALSRGARSVLFCERSRKVARVLEENLRALGLEKSATVRVADAFRVAKSFEEGAFDLVFLDPPYAAALDEAFLGAIAQSLSPGGTLVLERGKRAEDPPPPGLSLIRERVYGRAKVSFWEKPDA